MKLAVVYIMASRRNGTLYTGVTSDIIRRVHQHKEGTAESFTEKYGCKTLVYVEGHDTMEQAIMREKKIKGGSRKKKLALIESMNPTWTDLYDQICRESQ